ncbi:WD repeat domain-containing protein 83 isoform X1 [Ciconia boyciana]|uniref:WD repeat domain-containing protein 83 isoform X1 n=1 Tax=Ciconia boyciana TaxID=52775 RepID=UPI003B9EC353
MAFPRPRPARPELPRRRVRTLECGQGAVRAVRFNVDGNYCLTCGSDKTLKLWNPHKGTALRAYQGHGYEVLDATGSFDNSQLCSCGADKTVVLWDVATGQVVRKYRGHAGKVNCVQFNEEATIIVSGSIDSTVRCWDCRSRHPDPVQVLDEAKDGVSSVKVSDHEILSGSVDGRIRRYDLRAGQLYSDYVGTSASARTGSAPWPPASTPPCACWTRRRGSCWASTSPLPMALCPPGGAPPHPVPPGPPPQVHGPPQHGVPAGLRAERAGHPRGQRLRGRQRLLLGPGGGLAGAQPGGGPRRGAVPLLPPHPALPAHRHRGPRPALARGNLPARGGRRHVTQVSGGAGAPLCAPR